MLLGGVVMICSGVGFVVCNAKKLGHAPVLQGMSEISCRLRATCFPKIAFRIVSFLDIIRSGSIPQRASGFQPRCSGCPHAESCRRKLSAASGYRRSSLQRILRAPRIPCGTSRGSQQKPRSCLATVREQQRAQRSQHRGCCS